MFGVVIYLVAFLPIHDKPNFAVRSLIVTLAINLATVQTLLWTFGPQQKSAAHVSSAWGASSCSGCRCGSIRLVTIGTTVVLLGPGAAVAAGQPHAASKSAR